MERTKLSSNRLGCITTSKEVRDRDYVEMLQKEVCTERSLTEVVSMMYNKGIGLALLVAGLFFIGIAGAAQQFTGYHGELTEASMLAALVEAGKLPPIDERLPSPEDIAVVEPVEEIGQYGGTWHRVFFGPADFHTYGRIIYDNMLRFDTQGEIAPNIARAWESNEDGTVWQIYLRRGMKWSDGQPFTADDVLFWWEDIALDTNITPAPPSQWVARGEPMEVAKLDDYTVQLKFAGPNGVVPILLAHTGPQWPNAFERWGFFAPKHYLAQFHPKYNSDATYTLFEEKAFDLNPELPVVTAWHVVEWTPGVRLVAERNPYYWKVDPEGNQLPYIDQVVLDVVEDASVVQLRAMAGMLDMQSRHIDVTQLPALMASAEEGDYRVLLWQGAWPGNPTLFFNHNHPDPVMRVLFNNPKFKTALSHAIDRARINEVVYLDLAVPRQNSLPPISRFHDPELDTIYTEYDPEWANQVLDEIGLMERDAEGYRLRPDGKTLTIVIDVSLPSWPGFMDALELVTEDWAKVGIKAVLNPVERSAFWARVAANQQDVGTWQTDEGIESVTHPWWVPKHMHSMMAPMYAKWVVTGGKEGWEPKGDFKRVLELHDQYASTPDPAEQVHFIQEIMDSHIRKNLWTIGTVGLNKMPVIVKNNFKNVPETAVHDWLFRTPGYTHPEQYFIIQQ